MKTTICSRYHVGYFWANYASLVLMLTGAGIASHYIFWSHYGHTNTGQQFFMIAGSFCVIVACYAVYYAFLGNPKIRMDKEFITVGDRTYRWEDLESTRLNCQVYTGYGTGRGVELHFSGKRKIAWIADYYANSGEMLRFIEECILGGREEPEERPFIPPVFADKPEVEWKGELFSSMFFYLALFFCMMGLIPFLLKRWDMLPILIPVLVVWIALGYQLFYVGLSEGQLIVKNWFFPWVEKGYPFQDIRHVRFEYRGRDVYTLYIETSDYRYRRFRCDTYTAETRRNLKRLLTEKVSFRDETTINPEPPSPVTHE